MSRPSHRVVVEPHEEGQTLAAIVRSAVEGLSWNRAKELCRTGRVSVDGQIEFDATRRLDADRVVEVVPTGQKRKSSPLDPDAIVHIDPQVVVVRKPAGLSSVPYDESERDTLLDRLREHLHQKTPLGIVQRLDKDTTGLLVFARTRAARKHLEGQFRKHSVERRYLALTSGHAEAKTHESHLVPNRGDHKRGSWRGGGRPPRTAKRAVTHVEVIERFEAATLVACTLETGRQHQIRIHLAEAGTPLLGERVYARRGHATVETSRPMLHAERLGFRHPTSNAFMQFHDPPPEDFEAVLRGLRS